MKQKSKQVLWAFEGLTDPEKKNIMLDMTYQENRGTLGMSNKVNLI